METENAAALAERVRGELARYEHPLFAFASCAIDNPQFPWTFQKQLYDCLHDYIIEMFTSNPQRKN